MTIHAPGRRLMHFIPLKFVQHKVAGGGRRAVGAALSLTSMIALSQYSWTTEIAGQKIEHKVFWPWFTLIGTLLTLSVAWVVNFFAGSKAAKKREGPA